jgi:D-xylono/L-arabinono-1,4-lactonase
MTQNEGPARGIRTEAHLVVDLPCETGEGPLWHEESRTLCWVDIPAGTLYRFEPVTGMNGVIYQHTGSIGGFTLQEDDSLVIFSDNGQIVRFHEGEVETISPGVDAMDGSRFNDVIADPEGRVFCGTMALDDGTAHLYRLDPDRSLHLIYDDLTLGNGMGFSPDLSMMYLTDSNTHRIYRMRYDQATGELSDREVLVQIPDGEGVPDGMAVDSDGTIWSARWGGGGIFHYSAEGELLERIEMPVDKVTSLAFGGEDLATAYVTSGGGQERGPENGTLAGSLFRLDLGVTGRLPFRSRIGL